jgi:hypothetical protein
VSNKRQDICVQLEIGGVSLIEDVLHEIGCLAVSRASCELLLHGRLRRLIKQKRIMRGRKLRSDGYEGKRMFSSTCLNKSYRNHE